MEIRRGEQFSLTCFQPPCFCQCLALGAVSIPAGVVGIPFGSTDVTFFNLTAKASTLMWIDPLRKNNGFFELV